MSSIKTYDRTIREPVRYIRTERAPAPAPATAAPLYLVLDAPGNVTLWSTNTSKQTYAVVQLPAHGRGPDQFGCLNSIWVRESGWNERAGHPASAYGSRRRTRYGTPCQAWAYGRARRYYRPLLAVVLGAD